QVKLRGFRIELGEIETALAAHPSIREVAVVLREDVPGDKRLAAYLVATREAVPNINQLREFLQERLPDYMVPAAFVFIESLPLTPSGKLDRRALPALDYARPELKAQFVAPRTEAERVLADIWSDVLRVERIGVHDGFFELGGDSILSIQVISRANEKGLRLLPKQIFQYQTIAQLANAAETAPQVEAEQGAVVGAFALTPIQRWFFEQEFADPHHFNQALTLEITQPFDTSRLPQIIERILEQHDALRLRFEKQRGIWQQLSGQADVAEVFLRVDLSHLPAEEQGRAIEGKAAELQQSLNLTTGPLLKVALFEAGEGRRSRLLIIIHHLVVDGVSWRILLEDLEKACRQSLAGERINLGAKTTSFKQWSERLAQHAQTRSVEAEAGYWRAEARRHVKPLPRETSGEGVDTVLHERRLSSSLSVEETRALLHEVGAAYHTQINDVLLAALVRTLSNWTGERRFLIDLEGHGREDILEGLDVSRTVGWFTTIFPVLLEQEGNWHPGETLRQVKEQLRAMPQRGIGYGLLRYLSQDESIRAQLAELPPAELIFNYLGQLDGTLSETGHFALARESAGAMRSPRARRPHLLDVSASIVGGQLQVAWSYGEQTLQRQTVEGLAAQFVEALREIIGHCLTAEPRWTPSDFPLAKLRQEQLDRILRARKQVEDIYALSPMQEGMLFQSLYEAGTGVYVTQVTCELRGELDIPIFEQSWQQVVNRHASLRTSFEWESLDAPVQVVNRQVEISLEQADWRGLEASAQHGLLESYLRTVREQGLNLSDAPLMKFALFRTGEDVYRFVWNCHHLLVDGWSLPIIIREVFAVYDARR
ncbi:MAG TPA: condensation domain-containing protein, partial [Pyrinomonadaceae bacterium]|nr:condensation domain-containing protein [Pyrinomonadaceae bacterium]